MSLKFIIGLTNNKKFILKWNILMIKIKFAFKSLSLLTIKIMSNGLSIPLFHQQSETKKILKLYVIWKFIFFSYAKQFKILPLFYYWYCDLCLTVLMEPLWKLVELFKLCDGGVSFSELLWLKFKPWFWSRTSMISGVSGYN